MGPSIDAATLQGMLDDPLTVVLDASWYLPAAGRDPEAEFLQGHVPGARRFDFDHEISDADSDLPHMLPTAEVFQAAVRRLGVWRGSRVVVYDGAGIFAAPRAWWMFKAMGHGDVAVLDGGLPAWAASGGTMETGAAGDVPQGDFVARPDPARLRSSGEVLTALDAGDAVVDARGAARFEGRVEEPRAGLRSGHMPGAVNLPFDLLIEDGRLRPAGEIRSAFQAAGVNGERPIVTTCGSGVTAAVLALGAEVAGLGPVAVYDGSWSEWGQEGSGLPVVTDG